MKTNLTELAKQIINLDSEELNILNNKINLFNVKIITFKDEPIINNPKEERLSQLLFGLKEKGFDKDNYFKNSVGEKILYYNSKIKMLSVSYCYIWLFFEREFNMVYDEIKEFITKYVVDTLQIEVSYTTQWIAL